jgi:hypothetical protein
LPQALSAAYSREWAGLLEEVYANCRERWHYRIPDDADEQDLLKTLCQRTLAFENYFLQYYRQFFLNILQATELEQGCWVKPGIADYFFDGAAPENIAAYHLQTRNQQGVTEIYITESSKILAARALGQVIFPEDEAIVAALQKTAKSQNDHLRAIAEQSLQRYRA